MEKVQTPDGRAAEWLLQRARFSAAVAVIKSRPSGQSGREHAEALARRLGDRDEDWKDRARGLQGEVLRLRQELLLSRLAASKPKSTVAAGDDASTVDPLSQDLMMMMMSPVEDSGCVTENDTEPPHPKKPRQQPEPPLASASGPASSLAFSSTGPGGGGSDPQAKAMLVHMQFLQSMCGLRKAATDGKDGRRGLEAAQQWLAADATGGDTSSSVMGDSVCQLLESIVVACKTRDGTRPRDLPPSPLLLQACQVVSSAVDVWGSQKQPLPEKMVTCVEESLKELIGALLSDDRLNRFHLEEKRTDCVVLLGGSGPLRSAIVHHVLCEINRLAEQLWNACQVKESTVLQQFMVSHYENSIYLFWILEQILQHKPDEPGQGRTRGSRTFSTHHHQQQNPWTSTQQKALLDNLEQRVFLLADEFPLFSLYMWRIGHLLSPTSTT